VSTGAANPASQCIPGIITTSHKLEGGTKCYHSAQQGSEFIDRGTVVYFDLTDTDMNAIKLNRNLATSECDTFLELHANAVVDMNGNPGPVVSKSVAIQVCESDCYKADGVKPTLTAFVLDMDDGTLFMTFDETIIASSLSQGLDQGKFKLTSKAGDEFIIGALSKSSLADSTELQIKISNLDELKINRAGFISADTTILSWDDDAIFDMSSNGIAAGGDDTYTRTFIEDTTAPLVVDYTIDMGAGTLTIEFDEAVDVQTVKAQQFTIQDGNSPALSAPYPLTGTKTDYTGVDASNSFELEFTDTDLNALKRLNKLAVNALSSQLLILPAALSDMAVPANPLASVVITPSRHLADLISPNCSRLLSIWTHSPSLSISMRLLMHPHSNRPHLQY
jgi:hypothetical protein